MKKILLILGFIIGVSANGQNATYTDNDGDGVIEYVLTNDAGVVLETGFYYNRQKVRTWTSYYPNGKKETVARFRNGLRHGLWVNYDHSGKKVLEVVYKNGKKISASQHSYASSN
jgi:antitoxin component YwqK of YwqJK toxin-antitoxin module